MIRLTSLSAISVMQYSDWEALSAADKFDVLWNVSDTFDSLSFDILTSIRDHHNAPSFQCCQAFALVCAVGDKWISPDSISADAFGEIGNMVDIILDALH